MNHVDILGSKRHLCGHRFWVASVSLTQRKLRTQSTNRVPSRAKSSHMCQSLVLWVTDPVHYEQVFLNDIVHGTRSETSRFHPKSKPWPATDWMCLFDHTCSMRRPSKAISKRLPGPLLGLDHGQASERAWQASQSPRSRLWPNKGLLATIGHYGHRCPLWPPPPIISKSLFFVLKNWHRNRNIEASAVHNFNSSFCFNVSKKRSKYWQRVKAGRDLSK